MRKFQPNGKILAVGMKELKENFTGVNLNNMGVITPLLENTLSRVGSKRFCKIIEVTRLISLIGEKIIGLTGSDFIVKKGILDNPVLFGMAYFQAESMVEDALMKGVSLRQHILDRADSYLANLPCRPSDRFFVHVRRGDYTYWPSVDDPAVMSPKWYREQMCRVRHINPSAFFVIVSDDWPYVAEIFPDSENTRIHRGQWIDDFAVMTRCFGGGILSASSFSWWAAYFGRRERLEARYVAPKWKEIPDVKLPQVWWATSWIELIDRPMKVHV
jgi:hypothetical protein